MANERSDDVKGTLARISFAENLFEARENDFGKKMYGCTLLWPKTDDLGWLKKIIVEAAEKKWAGKPVGEWLKSGMIKSPLLDGDGPQGRSKKTGEPHGGFPGCWFIRAQSGEKFKPKVIDRKKNWILEAGDACYSGCYGYPVLSAFAWENDKGGKGVSLSISMIQIAKDGEKLGGGGGVNRDPDDFFDVIPDEGDAPAETKSGAGAAGLFG